MEQAAALFQVLGRHGAPAVVDRLLDDAGPWTLRGLAAAADVPPSNARRILDGLEALAVVEVLRPGRDAQIRRRDTPTTRWLAALPGLPLRDGPLAAFQTGYTGPGRAWPWRHPDDDERAPLRIVVLSHDDESALEAVGPALDAVAAAGWPAPVVTVEDPDALDPDDPVAAAMLQPMASTR